MTEGQSLSSIIEQILPDYFSDLNVDDIPDSEVANEPEEKKVEETKKKYTFDDEDKVDPIEVKLKKKEAARKAAIKA